MRFFSNLMTVIKRELAAYFNSAIAYIFIIVFTLLNGGLYMTQFFVIGSADMRPFFYLMPYFLAVFLPAITMRLWAEEKRGNTLELLLTFPMGTHELVIGKFVAAFIFYVVSLAGTLTIPVMLKILGTPDMGIIISGYIGCMITGAFFLAAGIFISGLCRDQIVAFILAMIFCFGTYLAGSQFVASSIDGWLPGIGSLIALSLGSAGHYEPFAKGVIDNRDIFYFTAGTALFLILNGFWLEGRMRKGAKKIFITSAIICAGIFLISNWFLSSVSIGRYDLTEGKVYTISPATKKILQDLKAPVTAKFYVSTQDKMPTGMKTLEQDVVAKLEEFKVASQGRFKYKIFHMEASNVTAAGKNEKAETLEEQLESKGIQPFQVRAIESDEVAVRLIYSAISLGYKEKSDEIIARVTLENLNELEYLLISKIYRMALPQVPKIALWAPYVEKQVEPEVKTLLTQLGGKIPEGYREDEYELLPRALEYEGYKVSRIRLIQPEPIPNDIKTFIVMEPQSLNERQRYEINRFLRGGGSVLLAVQNYMYHYSTNQRTVQIDASENKPGVNELLKTWGLEVDDQILVDEQSDVISLSSGGRLGPFEVSVPVKIPIQILINQSGMNPDMSITSRLSPVFYLWGTALKINKEKMEAAKLKASQLLQSSPESWTVPFRPGSLIPEHLKRSAQSSTGPFPLAVLIQGQFPDAYENKPTPDWPADTKEVKADDESKRPAVVPAPGKLIVMGASSPFQKSLFRSGGHLNLFLNMVDALTLGDELVSIRSKQPIDRTLDRLPNAAKLGWRFVVIFLVPLLIAFAGAARVFFRRQMKVNYIQSLSL